MHVHLGTQHQVAHVALLDGPTLAPGQRARVQLVFERPVCALPGDPFVVRNAQASRTIGGGDVLDPFAPARKRRSPARLAWLDAMQAMLDTGSVGTLLGQAPNGLSRALLERLSGMPAAAIELPRDTRVIELPGDDALLVSSAAWQALAGRLTTALRQFHQRSPDVLGPEVARLRRIAAPLAQDALWCALVDDACARGDLVRNGPWLHLPEHTVTLDDAERTLAATLQQAMKAGRFDPPWVRELASAHGVPEDRVRQLMRKLARHGETFQVVHDLFYDPEAIRELALLAAVDASKNAGTVVAGAFRNATGLGRNVRFRSWNSLTVLAIRASTVAGIWCARTVVGWSCSDGTGAARPALKQGLIQGPGNSEFAATRSCCRPSRLPAGIRSRRWTCRK